MYFFFNFGSFCISLILHFLQHLAERLEKRRHILEFRKLQEQQNQQEMLAEVHAFEQPIVDNLVKDGKLTEKQKEEILNEHEKNLQNLKKQQDIGKDYDKGSVFGSYATQEKSSYAICRQ